MVPIRTLVEILAKINKKCRFKYLIVTYFLNLIQNENIYQTRSAFSDTVMSSTVFRVFKIVISSIVINCI